MADVFHELLKNKKVKRIILYYDTTFDISEQCYMSLLSFMHPKLRTRRGRQPHFILMAVLHETKEERVHDRAMQMLHEEFPAINTSGKAIFILDAEPALNNAVYNWFPDCDIYRCVLHVLSDMTAKLAKLLGGLNKPLRNELKADFLQLLMSESKVEYDELLKAKLAKWANKMHKVTGYL